MNASTDLSFDGRAFRQCLGQFPTGVCIVTANVEGELLGMTMSSFNSLSLDPPLVLFSIDRGARGLPMWQRVSGYAVNILSEAQRELSDRFARSASNKWQGITFESGLYDAPILAGAAAVLECQRYSQHEAGDHTLFIAQVQKFTAHPSRTPLVFCKGAYGELKQTDHTAPIWPLDIHY
jgi:flavin reductase (DIM6/NTAB) family NADH-FMN oxidoreductase RutF